MKSAVSQVESDSLPGFGKGMVMTTNEDITRESAGANAAPGTDQKTLSGIGATLDLP